MEVVRMHKADPCLTLTAVVAGHVPATSSPWWAPTGRRPRAETLFTDLHAPAIEPCTSHSTCVHARWSSCVAGHSTSFRPCARAMRGEGLDMHQKPTCNTRAMDIMHTRPATCTHAPTCNLLCPSSAKCMHACLPIPLLPSMLYAPGICNLQKIATPLRSDTSCRAIPRAYTV